MKKLHIIALLLLVLLSSCVGDKHYQTDKLELRQLVKTTDTTKSAHGAFFLVAGSYSSSENIDTRIKMYVLVNGVYKYLEYDISVVRIKIDNTAKVPYLVISYSHPRQVSDENITDRPYWYSGRVVLTTHESYLPEQLLPITIK